MVEFGLKLEDNKVADWSDHYIQYDRLKAILKRAKAAQQRYDDLAAKKPETAALIRQHYQSGFPTPPTSKSNSRASTPHASMDNLTSLATSPDRQGEPAAPSPPSRETSGESPLRRIREDSTVSADGAEGTASSHTTESTGLSMVDTTGTTHATTNSTQQPDQTPQRSNVKHPTANYGATTTTTSPPSTTAAAGGTPTDSGDAGGGDSRRASGTPSPSGSLSGSLSRLSEHSKSSASNLIAVALEKAASGVSDYFSKSYQRQVRESLKEIDKYQQEFDEALYKSRDSVNKFYNEKLLELQERLQVLKESVAQSSAARKAAELEASTKATKNGAAAHMRAVSVQDELTPLNVEEVDLEAPLHHARHASLNLGSIRHRVTEGLQHLHPHRRESSTAGQAFVEVDDYEDDSKLFSSKEGAARVREAESIQRALVDQYRTAKLLHNFAIMNYTGFVKIVKKFDKTLPWYKGKYKSAIQPMEICNEGKAVESLADYMERLYANWFCNRNLAEARAQMLPKKGDGLEMDWSQMRLGYRMGMCAILAIWVCWDCIWGLVNKGQTTIGGRTAFPVFRACGGLLLLQWCWGCSVWVWSRYRVNYIYLFDFNPHIVESPLAIFNEAVDNTLVFLFGMLLYYKAGTHDVPGKFPAGVFPFGLVIYTCFQLIFPLRTRVPMWQAIWDVITAPMTSPTFFHGYVGDIFTSMVKIFQDMLWTFFFVLSGDWTISEDRKAASRHKWSHTHMYSNVLIPLVTLLPLWFRFNQCLRRYTDTGNRFPHLANAFKYALSQTVTLFGAFHPLYLDLNRGKNIKNFDGLDLFQFFWWAVFVTSSLYSFFWDVYQDWGLGRPKYGMLGPRLMYPRKSMYYMIMIGDFVLRFAWVLTLVPPQSGASFALPQYMTAVSLMLELFRRTTWGFLRLENEHRSNASGFRRVDFVPLHFSTGHRHEYKKEREHRGFSVLLEVSVVTLLVLGACVISVVMAQHATERFQDL